MEKAGGVLVLVGIILLAYSIIGAFVGSTMILSYIRPIKPSTGLVLANSFLLLGVLAKTCKKA